MTRSPHSYVTAALFLMCHVLSQVEAQQCKSEYSIYGAKLKGHVFEEKKTANFLNCVERCNLNLRCQSVNYVISQYVCESNRRTKEARPEDFVPDADRIYVTRLSGRGIIVPRWILQNKAGHLVMLTQRSFDTTDVDKKRSPFVRRKTENRTSFRQGTSVLGVRH